MLGSIRWNIALGLFGAILTFTFSIATNGIGITLLRSVYAFAFFFTVAFAFRFALFTIAAPATKNGVAEGTRTEGETSGKLDLVTPEDSDDLNRMLKEQMEGGNPPDAVMHSSFQPLSPPKLVSTQDKSAEELAQAVRHLAER